MLYTLATKDALKAAKSDMLPQAAEFMLCYLHKCDQAPTVTRQWKSRLEDWAAEQDSTSSATSTTRRLVIRTKVPDIELRRERPRIEGPRDVPRRRYEQPPESSGAERYRRQERWEREEEEREYQYRRQHERKREEDAREQVIRESERARAAKKRREREAEEEAAEGRKSWDRYSQGRESTTKSRPQTDVGETNAKLMQLLEDEVMEGPSEEALALILKVLNVLHQEAQKKRREEGRREDGIGGRMLIGRSVSYFS